MTVGNGRASAFQARPAGCTVRTSLVLQARRACLVCARSRSCRVHLSIPRSPHGALAHLSRSRHPRPNAFTNSPPLLSPSISRGPGIYRRIKKPILTRPSSVPAPPVPHVVTFELMVARVASASQQARAVRRPEFGAFMGDVEALKGDGA